MIEENLNYEEITKVTDKDSHQYRLLEGMAMETLSYEGTPNFESDYEMAMKVKAKYGANERYKNVDLLAREYNRHKTKLREKHLSRQTIKNVELQSEMIKKERLAYASSEFLVKNIINMGENLNLDKNLIIEAIINNSNRYEKLEDIRKEDMVEYIDTFTNKYPELLELSTLITRLMNLEVIVEENRCQGSAKIQAFTNNLGSKISWELNRKIIIDIDSNVDDDRSIFNHEATHMAANNYQTVYNDIVWQGLSAKVVNSNIPWQYVRANEGIVSILSDRVTAEQGFRVSPSYEIEKQVVSSSPLLNNYNMKDPEKNDEEEIKRVEREIARKEIDLASEPVRINHVNLNDLENIDIFSL